MAVPIPPKSSSSAQRSCSWQNPTHSYSAHYIHSIWTHTERTAEGEQQHQERKGNNNRRRQTTEGKQQQQKTDHLVQGNSNSRRQTTGGEQQQQEAEHNLLAAALPRASCSCPSTGRQYAGSMGHPTAAAACSPDLWRPDGGRGCRLSVHPAESGQEAAAGLGQDGEVCCHRADAAWPILLQVSGQPAVHSTSHAAVQPPPGAARCAAARGLVLTPSHRCEPARCRGFQLLDAYFGKAATFQNAITKSLVGQITLFPTYTPLFLMYASLLVDGNTWEQGLSRVKQRLPGVLVTGTMYW